MNLNRRQVGARLYDAARGAYLGILGLLPLPLRRRYLYWRAHGSLPNLRNPVLFSEKITWRILYDRRTRLNWTCDKAAMKQHVVATSHSVTPVPLVWFGNDVSELGNIQLPPEWVIKPNRQSGGKVHFGRGNPDIDELQRITRGWARRESRHIAWMGEWAYSQARAGFVVEPRIPGPTPDEPPVDYKVFTFGGVPRLIQVHLGRGRDIRQIHMYPDWTPAPIGTHISAEDSETFPPPTHLAEMLHQASELGAAFDFIRVDFYDTGDELLFGEVTPYPASGLRVYVPEEADRRLGDMWVLPAAGRNFPDESR